MKLKTAILKIYILFILLFSFSTLHAQQGPPTYSEGVNVNAIINVDLYSTITLNPTTVEINRPSSVEIRILSSTGEGISGRQVVIVASGLNITQPTQLTNITGRTFGSVSSSIPGTYTVCAKDVTFGYDIFLQNCRTLYVVPVPTTTIFPEPQYTKGTTNRIMWQSIGSNYRYNVQVSESSDFSTVLNQSGWIQGTSFEFTNLVNEKMYFYRVRVQNLFGGVSAWSNVVFSVQDTQAPVIETLNIGSLGNNNTVEWDGSYVVNMLFRVTDNLQLDTVTFTCVNSQGSQYNCTSEYTMEGDNLVVSIRLRDLERKSGVYLRDKYNFCIEATDAATNLSRECNIELKIPKGEEEVSTPTIPPIIKRIERTVEDINIILDDTIGQLEPVQLERATTATTVVTATSAVAIAAGSLWSLPYFLFQIFLNILTFLGFRKGAKPVGFVYDSITKNPVSQAIIRIFNEEGKMVWSDVSNSKGYFSARLTDGKYKISVRSVRHTFPSNIVFGKEDFPITDVYHGEYFSVSGTSELKYAIPMDPIEVTSVRLKIESLWGRFKYIVTFLHILLFLFAITMAIYTYINNPSLLTLVVLLLFIPTFFFILKNALTKIERYGIVKDSNGKPLSGVTIAIREAEFDKIVSKRVTDQLGRYRLLIDEGRYYIEILETGYKVQNIKGGNEIILKKEEWIIKDISLLKIVN
jgi:hypothetical protein